MPETAVTFIDIETTGLEVARHEVWEVAYIARRPGEDAVEGSWMVKVDLSRADPNALRLNHFYERYDPALAIDAREVAENVAYATAGSWLIGAVPSFDAGFLDRLLRDNSFAPAWHHRLVCVETYAAGRLGIRAGWDPAKLSEMLGVERPESDKHTALGDTRWALLMYDAALAAAPQRDRPAKAKAATEKKVAPTPDAAEPEPEAEAKPKANGSGSVLAQLKESGGECEDCKVMVPPDQAVLSMTRHRKVLCNEGEHGGCFARYGTVVETA